MGLFDWVGDIFTTPDDRAVNRINKIDAEIRKLRAPYNGNNPLNPMPEDTGLEIEELLNEREELIQLRIQLLQMNRADFGKIEDEEELEEP